MNEWNGLNQTTRSLIKEANRNARPEESRGIAECAYNPMAHGLSRGDAPEFAMHSCLNALRLPTKMSSDYLASLEREAYARAEVATGQCLRRVGPILSPEFCSAIYPVKAVGDQAVKLIRDLIPERFRDRDPAETPPSLNEIKGTLRGASEGLELYRDSFKEWGKRLNSLPDNSESQTDLPDDE